MSVSFRDLKRVLCIQELGLVVHHFTKNSYLFKITNLAYKKLTVVYPKRPNS